jgi:AraC-like DNA-binding protein
VDGVTIVRHSHNLMKFPVLYGPSLVFVVQGKKTAIFGSKTYVYDHQRYLVLTTVVPFVWSAITEKGQPVLSVFVHFRPEIVLELLGIMDFDLMKDSNEDLAVFEAQKITSEIRYGLLRLLEAANDPRDAKVLGPSLVRELLYRALSGPGGPSLRASLGLDGHFSQIARAIRLMQENAKRPVSVPHLAASVGMSPSAFHLHFKQVTKSSPLQYLKTLRLHQGRTLMLSKGVGVTEVAQRVGYESSSQFSREYKRLFGEAPVLEIARLRAEVIS